MMGKTLPLLFSGVSADDCREAFFPRLARVIDVPIPLHDGRFLPLPPRSGSDSQKPAYFSLLPHGIMFLPLLLPPRENNDDRVRRVSMCFREDILSPSPLTVKIVSPLTRIRENSPSVGNRICWKTLRLPVRYIYFPPPFSFLWDYCRTRFPLLHGDGTPR